jgi:hypothetical protein
VPSAQTIRVVSIKLRGSKDPIANPPAADANGVWVLKDK